MQKKSAQEVEIDHILAEEFACDSGFASRFLTICGLSCEGLRVTDTFAEPSLGGNGFGDLMVEGLVSSHRKVALLIEDKITAGPAVRQAERYAAFADVLRANGFDHVWTILVAPASYHGERDRYDACVSLEQLATIIQSADRKRCDYRRGIIAGALSKKARAGVKIPDPAMFQLKAAYLLHAAEWCAGDGFGFEFPALRESYYDGDSWIDEIKHRDLHSGVKFRHRFWTTARERSGNVDLIIGKASADDRQIMTASVLEGALTADYSAGKGIRISLPVAELRQRPGFDEDIASQAFEAMRRLLAWYVATFAPAPVT